jgi:hypothetical protein
LGYNFTVPEDTEDKKKDDKQRKEAIQAFSNKFQSEMQQLYMKN